MISRLIYIATAALSISFLVVPLLVVMPLAFNSSSFLSYPLDGFSMKWFEAILSHNGPWLFSFGNSLKVAVGTTILSVVLGGFAALGATLVSNRVLVSILIAFFMSPMVIPAVVLAVAMFSIFARMGLGGSIYAMIFGHAILGTPLVFLSVLTSMRGIDPDLDSAAASLGASRWTRFWTVILPLAAPGFATGALFAFSTSFDEVVISLFLTSPQTITLPIVLFSSLRDKLQPSIVAVALLLTLTSAMLLYLVARVQRSTAKSVEK